MDFEGDVDRYIYKLSLNNDIFFCDGKYFGIKDNK